jgi:hypothetical protein
MRGFVSRRFGPWRAGVSVGTEDFRQRRRGRPANVAMVNRAPIVRPARSFYGVRLDQPEPSAELPRERHVWRTLWSIVTTLVWLLVHGILWAGFGAIMLFAALVLVMK